MTDSSSFTSLMALVDSHLSKIDIQESCSENVTNIQPGTLSDARRLSLPPGPILPIPTFQPRDSSIQDVLAEQIANMLKTKELMKQKEDEKLRLAEEVKKMKSDDDGDNEIDLSQALHTPWVYQPPIKKDGLSSSSSFESLFDAKFINSVNVYTPTNDNKVEDQSPELLVSKMNLLCFRKVRKMKRCSAFGQVLSSRLRPVAAPYLREYIKTTVVPFDFSTPSPCDIIKAKLRKPTTSSPYTYT